MLKSDYESDVLHRARLRGRRALLFTDASAIALEREDQLAGVLARGLS
jgi:hypothetical protein